MALALRCLAIVALLVYTLAGFAVFTLTHPDGWLGAGLTLAVASGLPWSDYWHR